MANLKTPTPAKKKLLNPKEDPPTASSSDEEDETSSGEEEEQIAVSPAAKEDSGSDSGSESDSDSGSGSEPLEKAMSVTAVKSKSSQGNEPKIPSSKTLKPPSAVSAAGKQDSGSDSGSETDSGSEPEEPPEKAVSVTVTPLKSKKKEVNASPAVKSVKKRGNEGASTEVKAKRAKKVSGDEEEKKSGEENKKPPFQRLWSEEDEISLLQGMIDFKAETGTSPFDDMNGFYDKVKKCISFDVSKSQFADKIRGLKKNYFAGKKKSLESSHDRKCLGLVKFIWGSDGMGPESSLKSNKKVEKKKEVKGSGEIVESAANSSLVKSEKFEKKKEEKGSDVVVKSDGKGKKVEEDKEEEILGGDFEKSFLFPSIVSLGVDESSLKRKWSNVPLESKKRIEEMFKLVEAKDYESLLMKADILKEVASVLS